MRFLLLLSVLLGNISLAQFDPKVHLSGNWIGIDMYQDADSYDGKNFYLPNEEFIIIDQEKIKIYFYPYSKSDEFDVKIDDKTIYYKVGRKTIETDYSFTNERADTLVFTMHFINKTFVKLYHRVTSINEKMEVDFATIKDLDEYGFNPSALYHLFELDTFHHDLYKGFDHIDSLPFKPFNYLQFLNDNEISVNRGASVKMSRGYKKLMFEVNGELMTITIFHAEGTQNISIIPTSQCNCDSIVIPYLTVDWADRIRRDMKENSYKYRN